MVDLHPFSSALPLYRSKRLLWLAIVLAGHGYALTDAFLRQSGRVANSAPGVLQVSWVEAEKKAPPIQPEARTQPKPLPVKARPARAPHPQPRPKTKPILTVAGQTADFSSENRVAPTAPDKTDLSLNPPSDNPKTAEFAAEQSMGDRTPDQPPSFKADYLSNPAPEYPEESRELKEQGVVTLRILVSVEGRSEQVQLSKGSGFSLLDQAAIEAVRNWRFIPARHAGLPVAGWVVVPIRFSLRS